MTDKDVLSKTRCLSSETVDDNILALYYLTSGPNEISNVIRSASNPREARKAIMLQIHWQILHHLHYINSSDKLDTTEMGGQQVLQEFKNWMQNQLVEPNTLNKLTYTMLKVHTKLQEKSDNINAIRNDAYEYQKRHESSSGSKINSTTTAPSSSKIFQSGFFYKNATDFIQKHTLLKCHQCGSKDIKQLDAVSHSTSRESLMQLYTCKLPSLHDKAVLDIGSGLGSILFGCCVLSDAKSVCGIEINKPFCEIVETVAKKVGLSEKIKVIQGDLRDHQEILKTHHVVIFNNAFEYFLPVQTQIELWTLIRHSLQSGTLLVTNPNLECIFKKLDKGLGFTVSEWVDYYANKIDRDLILAMEKVDEDFCIYTVK